MKTAPEAPARPAPGAVPSEPLHGPVEAAEDSLDGLQTAFGVERARKMLETKQTKERNEAGSDPRGHPGVIWGVYLCAGKPPLADIILSHPPDLTSCDSVIGLAIPAMSGHIQYRGAAS